MRVFLHRNLQKRVRITKFTIHKTPHPYFYIALMTSYGQPLQLINWLIDFDDLGNNYLTAVFSWEQVMDQEYFVAPSLPDEMHLMNWSFFQQLDVFMT